MKAIKGNLKDQIGSDEERMIMWCPCCDDEFSANAGDYWYLPDDHQFTCENCGCALVLGYKRIVYEEA